MLIELSHTNESNYNKKQIGKKLEVLWEEKDKDFIKGHTSNYIVVKASYKPLENQITRVKILKEDSLELIGEHA